MDHFKYKSIFLPEIEIGVVFSENKEYPKLKPLFDKLGFGFMVPNQNMIVIDGEMLVEYGGEILKFIEAHEIAHIILGHDGPRNPQDEIDADLGAYLLLSKINAKIPLQILLSFFESRHGIEFNEEMLETIKKHFSDYL
jgi:Zn-dependent peptidase ImmA (M78 family)